MKWFLKIFFGQLIGQIYFEPRASQRVLTHLDQLFKIWVGHTLSIL